MNENEPRTHLQQGFSPQLGIVVNHDKRETDFMSLPLKHILIYFADPPQITAALQPSHKKRHIIAF